MKAYINNIKYLVNFLRDNLLYYITKVTRCIKKEILV